MKKRTTPVWVISLYFIVSGVFTVFAYGIGILGVMITITDPAFPSLTWSNPVAPLVTLGVALAGLVGGCLLLNLSQRSAMWFFACAFIGAIGIFVRLAGFVQSSASYIGPIIGIVIYGAVAIYSKRVTAEALVSDAPLGSQEQSQP